VQIAAAAIAEYDLLQAVANGAREAVAKVWPFDSYHLCRSPVGDQIQGSGLVTKETNQKDRQESIQ